MVLDRRRADRQGAIAAVRRPGRALRARSMRDDMASVTAPPRLPNGAPNPAHIDRAIYLVRARDAALGRARANDTDPRRLRIAFPDADAFPPFAGQSGDPCRPRLSGPRRGGGVGGRRGLAGGRWGGGDACAGKRRRLPGPLVYRNGEGMRPDVAAAFDRMTAAARRSGISLIVVSGFRSDAAAGAALRPAPRSDLGRAAGPFAAPLRDRARPRPGDGLRMAVRERPSLRFF